MATNRSRWAGIIVIGHVALSSLLAGAAPTNVTSPSGRIVVGFQLNNDGAPRYRVRLDDRPVLDESRLGLVRDDADFTRGLELIAVSAPEPVEDRYEILTAKRRLNTYRANRQVYHLQTAAGHKLDITFQVSDDGVAFRYTFPENSATAREVREETSSFRFRPGTKAWLQPMSVAKSGWKATNPSYEEYYQMEIDAGTPSTLGAGWVYPALLRTDETWVLISETALGRNYCGTRLRHESPGGEYSVGFPDARETMHGRPAHPVASLPWQTPWRLLVIGSLKTVAESMLGLDLATPSPEEAPAAPIRPGRAAWSWPLLGDAKTSFDVQRQFIDYAAEMGWEYCLIDALWDVQIGDEKIKELVDYARGKDVGVLLWFNSNGTENDAPQTPKNRLLTRESRAAEFARLQAIGIRGLKVDFFAGDGQPVINYYHDLLEESARYGLLMNFHGATLPRGWSRTYPHLMTMEAVRGLEFITFEQANADQAPSHAAVLPFTRNVFEPMDFTPMVLDRINRIERRTTSAHELALAVLFTSGIQHYAEIPAGMAKAPDYVREFIKHIPAAWDDVRFIDGYPGRYAVIARRSEGRWYIAGINGEPAGRDLVLDLGGLRAEASATLSGATLITDGTGGNLVFRTELVSLLPDLSLKVRLAPHGGFVIVAE